MPAYPETVYRSAAAMLGPSQAYLDAVVSLARAVDRLAKRRWDAKKTGEAHLASAFLERTFGKFVTVPTVPNLTLQPVSFPDDDRFVKVKYEGTRTIPSFEGDIEHSVIVDVYLWFRSQSGSRTVYELSVALVKLVVTPPVEDPNQYPPALFAYRMRREILLAYDEILQQLRDPNGNGRAFWTFAVPSAPRLPSPYAVALLKGISVFLHSAADQPIRRSPRDRAEDFVMEIGVKRYKDTVRTAVAHRVGSVGDNESDFELAEVRNVRLGGASRIDADVYYHFHEFIGGDKGCNWLYCYDYRMWIGAKDDIPIRVQFASRVYDDIRVTVVATPEYDTYDDADDALYYKNLRLIINLGDWVLGLKDRSYDFINNQVNARISSALSEQEFDVPLPDLPAGVAVDSSQVALNGADGEETMRITVSFSVT